MSGKMNAKSDTSRDHGNQGSSEFNQPSTSSRKIRRLGDNKYISASYDLITPPGSPIDNNGVPNDGSFIDLSCLSDDSDCEIINDVEPILPTNGSIIDPLSSPNSGDEIQPPINNNIETEPLTVTITNDEIKPEITPNEENILTMLAERKCVALTPNIVPYKIKDKILQGKLISCINVEPFSDQKFMVTLENLRQTILFPYSLQSCRDILCNTLKTKLYRGNSEQMKLLLEKKLVKSLLPDDVPLVMFDDLIIVLVKLKIFLYEIYRKEFDDYYSISSDDDVEFVDSGKPPSP